MAIFQLVNVLKLKKTNSLDVRVYMNVVFNVTVPSSLLVCNVGDG